jgi:hypothetical protein
MISIAFLFGENALHETMWTRRKEGEERTGRMQ